MCNKITWPLGEVLGAQEGVLHICACVTGKQILEASLLSVLSPEKSHPLTTMAPSLHVPFQQGMGKDQPREQQGGDLL